MAMVSGVGTHSHADRGDDFYASHRVAVDSIVAIESEILSKAKRIWEPACGDGAIVNVLREHGHEVFASDLVDRGCPDSRVGNFLKPTKRTADLIITNPPFRLAQEFVDVALQRAPVVILLLRVAFLESRARMEWFKDGPLVRVHISSRRLPMMHRDGWEGKKAGSAIAHAWFVWDQNTADFQYPDVKWFDWKELSPRANWPSKLETTL